MVKIRIIQNKGEIIPHKPIKKDWEIDCEANSEKEKEVFFVF